MVPSPSRLSLLVGTTVVAASGSVIKLSTAFAFVPSPLLSTKAKIQTQSDQGSWKFIHGSAAHRATAISSDDDILSGIEALDNANSDITSSLSDVCQSPYFRLFSVDILASCEYMPQELFECYSETCEIYPVDDEEIPDTIRTVDFDGHEFELDGWARWDMPSEDYYDTDQFPDGYTGYDGSEVWNYIHNKICFQGYRYHDNHWKADFNKAVSGLHATVSAQVIRGIDEKVQSGETFTGDEEKWQDPRLEFDRRLSPNGETPEAMENLYFTYALFLSAVAKARGRLLEDCDDKIVGSHAEHIKQFLSLPILGDKSVEKVVGRLGEHAAKDTTSLWEARMRSRELLRIMNCVQCNKCRLHGKILMMGVSTALQIHLGWDGHGADTKQISRVELAALVTSVEKLSRAIELCKSMQS